MKKEIIIAGIMGLSLIGEAKADLFQCNACPAGNACDGVNKIACTPGTYAGVGASTCTDCQAGTYQQYSGQASCNACGVGQTSEAKATSCTDCSNKPANSHYTTVNSCDWSCDEGYSSHDGICCQNGYAKSNSGKCCPATKKVTITQGYQYCNGQCTSGPSCSTKGVEIDLKLGKCEIQSGCGGSNGQQVIKTGTVCYDDC